MHSHAAIQAAVNGKSLFHAKRLGVSLSLVSKWQEPSTDFTDSGAYNPLDRLETIIETSLSLGNGPERAYAPAYYLAQRFGMIIIQAPAPGKTLPELHRELSRLTREFGDVLSASGAAFADGAVSRREAIEIRDKGLKMQRELATFMAMVDTAAEKRK